MDHPMKSRTTAILSEIKSLIPLDRLGRFALPLLLVLVIVALCCVNILQSRTIAAQEALIHTLEQDSLELSSRKMQLQEKPRTADFKSPDLRPEQPQPKKTAEQ